MRQATDNKTADLLGDEFDLAGSTGVSRPGPAEIVAEAIARYKPVAIYVGFSGGNDSRAVAHWMMNNVPGCRPFHINTGIGIERTRQYVRDTCALYGWNLREIRALEDCGESYDALCIAHGFPGPDGHQMMYSRLKERGVRQLVREAKDGRKHRDTVLIASGIRHDESLIRMGYAGREINKVDSQVWINPLYWWPKEQRDAYNAASGMPENPVTKLLGMSGECGCGAFAQPGELARWAAIDPEFGERVERLQKIVLQRGFTWSWEGRPPRGGCKKEQGQIFQRPLCVGCEKSAIVQAEFA
jgi:3'-phosphoadenosine 5'-phosphosulfate sulfotransferase (PAPS reductase)/FAD synthetase